MKLDKNQEIVSVIFTNNNQTSIRIVVKDTNNNDEVYELDTSIMGGDRELWDQVVSMVPLEKIAEYTADYAAVMRRMQVEVIGEYAKNAGLVFDPGQWSPNEKLSIDNIFVLPEGDTGQDFLFELKLRLFDLKEIAESTDQASKTAMREATTPLEAFYHAGKMLFSE